MSKFIIEFFEKSDGTYPEEEFILSHGVARYDAFDNGMWRNRRDN